MRPSRLRAALAFAIAAAFLVPLGSAGAAAPTACSWSAKSEPDTVNAAYPDTNASYWSYAYRAVPGTELVIRGAYPRARYFSFHVYQPSGVPLDSLYDARIEPDKGSANPFAGQGDRRGLQRYTAHVVFSGKPATPARNTLYAGKAAVAGSPNAAGILMLRVYVPTDPWSPQGSVPLPTVTWQTTAGTVLTEGKSCSSDLPNTGGSATDQLNQGSWPDVSAAPGGDISWGKAFGNAYVGFFGNQQNAYLTAGIDRAYGSLVVIRARAPLFPDTVRGIWPSAHDQVRYWSICQNSASTRVNACVSDAQAVRDRHGYFLFVVSDPAQRPSNADARHGVTWIPWGAADEKALLIYRNMVPASGFTHAIQRVTKGDDPEKVMGVYYPEARYCTKEKFQSGGWRGCLE